VPDVVEVPEPKAIPALRTLPNVQVQVPVPVPVPLPQPSVPELP
jgi:hypothetical protein